MQNSLKMSVKIFPLTRTPVMEQLTEMSKIFLGTFTDFHHFIKSVSRTKFTLLNHHSAPNNTEDFRSFV